MAKQKIEDMNLEETVVETEVTGNTAVAVRGTNVITELNQDFEGIDSIANFLPYFIIDGTDYLNKVTEKSYKSLEIKITGGKPIWQLWDQEQTLVAESFDGVTATGGQSMQELLAQTKAKYPGQEEKIKIQGRYDLFFEWDYEDEGTKLTKISLSPSSKYAFSAYSKDLAKQGLGVGSVTTCLTAKRIVSKQGYRYSVAVFEQM